MNTNQTSISHFTSRSTGAFTILELLVVVVMVGFLACIHVARSNAIKDRTHVGQCAANLRQFTVAMHLFGNENDNQLPGGNFGGSWAWDAAWQTGTFVESTGAKWQSMYCPGTSFRFSEQDNLNLYNWTPGNVRVLGYSLTFGGANVNTVSTNLNFSLIPSPIIVGFGPQTLPAPSPSQRVLMADATISAPGQNNKSNYLTYNFTSIVGGYRLPHTTSHLKGTIPFGGNLAMLDGHVEWRSFDKMEPRTMSVGGVAVFWW